MQQAVEIDARFIDIGNLPSNFIPYSFKNLYIRPFTVKELKLISRAAVTQEIRHLIRAVDMAISVPVNEITIGDFYYILMWLRIHSYPKSPFVVNWECNAEYYEDGENNINREGKGIKKICKTLNTEVVHISNIDIITLDDDFEGLPEELDFPRVEILESVIEAMTDPDLVYIIPAAQWIKNQISLQGKVEYLENQNDLSLFDTAYDINERIVHGVKETIRLRCRKCANTFDYNIEINPLTFFRT